MHRSFSSTAPPITPEIKMQNNSFKCQGRCGVCHKGQPTTVWLECQEEGYVFFYKNLKELFLSSCKWTYLNEQNYIIFGKFISN